MHPSDLRWRRHSPALARPTQPLSDLCLTSRGAWLCGLPNLSDLGGPRAYIGVQSVGGPAFYMCAYRSVRLGRSDKASHSTGFSYPTSKRRGREVRERLGQFGALNQRQATASTSVDGSSLARSYAGRTAANLRQFQGLNFGSLLASRLTGRFIRGLA